LSSLFLPAHAPGAVASSWSLAFFEDTDFSEQIVLSSHLRNPPFFLKGPTFWLLSSRSLIFMDSVAGIFENVRFPLPPLRSNSPCSLLLRNGPSRFESLSSEFDSCSHFPYWFLVQVSSRSWFSPVRNSARLHWFPFSLLAQRCHAPPPPVFDMSPQQLRLVSATAADLSVFLNSFTYLSPRGFEKSHPKIPALPPPCLRQKVFPCQKSPTLSA